MEGVPVPDTSNVGNNKTLFEGLGVVPPGPVNYKPDEVIYPGTVVQDTATGMKAEEEAQRVAEGMAYEMNQAKQKGRYVNYVNPGAMRPPKPDGPPPPDTPPPPSEAVPTSVPEPVSSGMELEKLPGNPGFAPTGEVVESMDEEPMSGGAGSKRRRSKRRRSERRRSEKRRSERRRSKKRRSERRQSKRRQSKRRRSEKRQPKRRRSERRQSKRRRSKKPIRKHRTQRKKNNV